MGSERHWEMSWNYSQHTIGARRGPLDQYRYVCPGFFWLCWDSVLCPNCRFPSCSHLAFRECRNLPLRYNSVQEVRQRPIEMRPTQLSLGVGGHDGANQLDETGTNAHKQSYEVQRARV